MLFCMFSLLQHTTSCLILLAFVRAETSSRTNTRRQRTDTAPLLSTTLFAVYPIRGDMMYSKQITSELQVAYLVTNGCLNTLAMKSTTLPFAVRKLFGSAATRHNTLSSPVHKNAKSKLQWLWKWNDSHDL